MTRRFQWKADWRGAQIEEFMLTLCLTLPGVAKEILKLGFGNLSHWYGGRRPEDAKKKQNELTWKNAACGCLVGQASLSALKLVPGARDLLMKKSETTGRSITDEAPYVLYIAIVTATNRDISSYKTPTHIYEARYSPSVDPLLTEIYNVGMMVSEEGGMGNANRSRAVGDYLLDYIRVVLTDIGFKNLPKSPERSVIGTYAPKD